MRAFHRLDPAMRRRGEKPTDRWAFLFIFIEERRF